MAALGSRVQDTAKRIFQKKYVILRTQNTVDYFSKIGGTSVSSCDFSKVIIFVRGSLCDYLIWELKKLAVSLLHCLWAALKQDAIGSMIAT